MVTLKTASNEWNVSMSLRHHVIVTATSVLIAPNVTHMLTMNDVIKWKHFPRCWPFVQGIHRSPVNSPHKGQWRGALMFSLICVWINGWVNNHEAGDLRRYRAHYDVIVMHWPKINPNRIRQCHRINWEIAPWSDVLLIARKWGSRFRVLNPA